MPKAKPKPIAEKAAEEAAAPAAEIPKAPPVLYGANEDLGDMRYLPHASIAPDPANPRKDFDEEEIGLLASSIVEHGLMQNLVVTHWSDDAEGKWRLVAGERRWRAIGVALADKRLPADFKVPVRVVSVEDAKHRAIMALLENCVRQDLKPLEEAAAFQALTDVHGLGTDEIAEKIHRTRRMVQQRLQLLELSAADRKRLEKGEMTIEGARRRLANRPAPLVLTLSDTLALLEVRKKQRDEPYYRGVACAPDAPSHSTYWYVGDDHDTGGWQVHLHWIHERALEEHRPKSGAEDIDAWIDSIAIEIAGDGTALEKGAEGYYTAWLNGPFEIPEDRAAKAAQRRADIQARDERFAEERRKSDEAHRQYNEAFSAAVVLAQEADASTFCAELSSHLVALGLPLPWRIAREHEWHSDVVALAANGANVYHRIPDILLARMAHHIAGVAEVPASTATVDQQAAGRVDAEDEDEDGFEDAAAEEAA